MSFLNPIPVPATLYSSEDTDAPQLSNTDWTGAIKTILKACLVTGYGTKPGQGWVMSDETANVATFTPGDPAAPQVGLYVDSSQAAWSRVDLVWQGERANIPDTQTGMRLGRNPASTHTTQPWHLIATPRGFCFLPGYPYGAIMNHSIVYFGGINHNLIHPAGQDFVFYGGMPLISSWNCSSLAQSIRTAAAPSAASHIRTAGALGGQAPAANGTFLCANSFGTGSAFPTAVSSPPTTSRLYGGVYIARGYDLIGQMPGLLIPSHRLSDDTAGQIMRIEGSAHDWLFTHQNSNVAGMLANTQGCGLLVNCNEWVY